ncbi:hypothetical protein HDU93_001996, partial [Gonapodya sp. JEL0774]
VSEAEMAADSRKQESKNLLGWMDLGVSNRWKTANAESFSNRSMATAVAVKDDGTSSTQVTEIPWKTTRMDVNPSIIKKYDRGVHFFTGSREEPLVGSKATNYASAFSPPTVTTTSTGIRRPVHTTTDLLYDDPALLNPQDTSISTFRASFPTHTVGQICRDTRARASECKDFNSRTSVLPPGTETDRQCSVTKDDFSDLKTRVAKEVPARKELNKVTNGKGNVTFGDEEGDWLSETKTRFMSPKLQKPVPEPKPKVISDQLVEKPTKQSLSHFSLGSDKVEPMVTSAAISQVAVHDCDSLKNIISRRPAGIPSSVTKQIDVDAFKLSLTNTMPVVIKLPKSSNLDGEQPTKSLPWKPWVTQSQMSYLAPAIVAAGARRRGVDSDFEHTKQTVQRTEGGTPGWTTNRGTFVHPELMLDRTVYVHAV